MFSVGSKSHTRGSRRGFTLIELVVVLAILAAIAGLVIPKIDFVQQSANSATAADASGAVASNLQLYSTTKGTYPNRFDSLMEASGDLYGNGTGDTTGLFFSSTPGGHSYLNFLTAGSIPAGGPGVPDQSYVSWFHAMGDTVMDHSTSATSPSDSGITPRVYTTTTGSFDAFPVAVVSPSAPTGANIIEAIYPGQTPAPGSGSSVTLPAGVTLVALGVGSSCTAVGSTMLSAPIYGGLDQTVYYSRYIAIFAVYANGQPAQLKAVVDPAGQTINNNLTSYFQNKNNKN